MPSVGWSAGQIMRISLPKDRRLKSPIFKRAVDIGFARRVSEDSILARSRKSLQLKTFRCRASLQIDSKRQYANLSSAIRLHSRLLSLRWKGAQAEAKGRETRPPFQGFEASFYWSASRRSRRDKPGARQPQATSKILLEKSILMSGRLMRARPSRDQNRS